MYSNAGVSVYTLYDEAQVIHSKYNKSNLINSAINVLDVVDSKPLFSCEYNFKNIMDAKYKYYEFNSETNSFIEKTDYSYRDNDIYMCVASNIDLYNADTKKKVVWVAFSYRAVRIKAEDVTDNPDLRRKYNVAENDVLVRIYDEEDKNIRIGDVLSLDYKLRCEYMKDTEKYSWIKGDKDNSCYIKVKNVGRNEYNGNFVVSLIFNTQGELDTNNIGYGNTGYGYKEIFLLNGNSISNFDYKDYYKAVVTYGGNINIYVDRRMINTSGLSVYASYENTIDMDYTLPPVNVTFDYNIADEKGRLARHILDDFHFSSKSPRSTESDDVYYENTKHGSYVIVVKKFNRFVKDTGNSQKFINCKQSIVGSQQYKLSLKNITKSDISDFSLRVDNSSVGYINVDAYSKFSIDAGATEDISIPVASMVPRGYKELIVDLYKGDSLISKYKLRLNVEDLDEQPEIKSIITKQVNNRSVSLEVDASNPGNFYYLVKKVDEAKPVETDVVNQEGSNIKGVKEISFNDKIVDIQGLQAGEEYVLYAVLVKGNSTSRIKEYQFVTRNLLSKPLTVTNDNVEAGQVLANPEYTKPVDTLNETVRYTGVLRKDGSEYDSFSKPTEVGNYTVTVSCETEDYMYTGKARFKITPIQLTDSMVTVGDNNFYTGENVTVMPAIVYNNSNVSDKFNVYGNINKRVGEYVMTVSAKTDSNFDGTVNIPYSIVKKRIVPDVSGFTGNYIYTGLSIIPDLDITNPENGQKLKTSDYSVEYANNVNAGTASYVIRSEESGNYDFDEIRGTYNIGKARIGVTNVSVEIPVKVYVDTLLSDIKLIGEKAIASVKGKLELIAGQVLKVGRHTYNWIFKSEDSNYEDVTGTVEIEVSKKVPVLEVEDITTTYNGSNLSPDYIQGSAKVDGNAIDGLFTWKGSIPKNAKSSKYTAVFTPANTEQYETVEKEINVTINKALPAGDPLFDEITFIGKKLSDVNLRVGAISTTGTITFDATEDTVVEKGKSYDWTFTPADTENYLTLKGNIIPFNHIVKKTPTVAVNAINTVYNGSGISKSKITGTATVDGVTIDGTYDWKESAPITVADSGTHKVVFTPNNTDLYNTVEADCSVTITKATPEGIPSFVEITEEDLTLKDTEISIGTINTAGTVSWKLPETTKVIKSTAYEWKFVPTDSANYNMLEGSLIPCTVITPKKVPVLVMQSINTAYDGNPIPVTEIKGKATCDGNILQGKFKWKNAAPVNKSDSGVHEVIFTPNDTRHYEVVTVSVNVTISKNKITGKPEITPITTGGKTLRDVNLRRGTLTPFNGTLKWDISELSAVAQATEYHWTYTPTDLDNYDVVKGSIVVWKGVPNLTLPDIKLTYNGKAVPESVIAYVAKVGDTLVPGNITWKNGSPTNVSESGEYDVIFTPNDLEKYSKVEGKVKVTIEKAKTNGKPKVTEINKPGMTLADAKLLKGTLPEDGTLTWDKPLNTKVEKATTYTWTYTPNNPNYETLTGTITVYPEPVQVSNSVGSSGFRKVTYNDEDTSNKRAKELAKKVKVLETPKNKEEEKIIADAKVELKLSNSKASSINKELEALAKQVSKTDKEQGKLIEKLIDNNVPASKKKSALNKISEKAKEDIAKTVLNQYSDVKPNEWYSKDLSMMIGMDLLRGTSGSTIDPNKNITGKELVAMLVRAKDANITPVAGPRWFELYKDEAKTMKLLDGIKLDLNKDLSRAEVTRLVHNYVATVDKKDANKVNVKSLDKVVDSKDIPKEYLKDVAYLYDRDIFVGYEDSSFRPNQNISRLETAIVVSKLLKY